MRLDKILENIKAADTTATEKVASQASTGTGVTRDQLMAALNDATGGTKLASAAASPTGDLMKIASEVAEVEKEAALKEAQLLGHAFADAVVSRVGQWQQAAGAVKVASADMGGDFDKFASDNAELVKEAAATGYVQTRQHLEKVAADEYNRGYNETLEAVQKLAAEEFAKAAQLTSRVIDYVQSAP